MEEDKLAREARRNRLHEIIFEADTPAGKAFDVLLLVAIVLSVLVLMLESMQGWSEPMKRLFVTIEWVFTVLFTIEYVLRLYATLKPMRYASSFYGVIDLLSILPTYLSLIFAGSHYFTLVRALRLLRIFRIFKLTKYLRDSNMLRKALIASSSKIFIFLFVVIIIVLLIGTLMYFVESGKNPGFSSIPAGVYWAVVTLTTVGFGDITPQTDLGKFISVIVMILGYGIIAVPTGIVTNELMTGAPKNLVHNTQVCRHCTREGHDEDAVYCKYCGEKLNL